MDSKFQSERAGALLQLAPTVSIKENAPIKKEAAMVYDNPLSEMPKKVEPGKVKSVYNIDLEKYNQMMRAGGRVPGMIIKK